MAVMVAGGAEAEAGGPRRRLRSQCRQEGAEAEAVLRREPAALALLLWEPGAQDKVGRRAGSEGGLASDRPSFFGSDQLAAIVVVTLWCCRASAAGPDYAILI